MFFERFKREIYMHYVFREEENSFIQTNFG